MSAGTANRSGGQSDRCFATVMITFLLFAFLLTALAPVAVSVIAVFLFAGPHNYAEARYFLTRLPPKLGRLKPFFLLSAFGVVSLSLALPCLSRLPQWLDWPDGVIVWLLGLWNSFLLLWCTALVWMRSHQTHGRDWSYVWPIGLGLTGVFLLQPIVLPLLLVYLHPLMGFWILDRELHKSRPEWQRVFRQCLLVLPILLALVWQFSGELTGDSRLFSSAIHDQITHHVGGSLFTEMTCRKLISVHAFLELLHYGIWLAAVPAANGRVFSNGFLTIPIMKRAGLIRSVVKLALVTSVMVVAGLWLGFIADYRTTRDIYFTVATVHVLAEVPFLLRLL